MATSAGTSPGDTTVPPVTLAFALSLIWPQPRFAETAATTRLHPPLAVVAPAEFGAPAALLRRELRTLFGADALGEGGTAIRLEPAPDALPHGEEFALEPGQRGLVLRAHDEQGAFWAVHTLSTLLEHARRAGDGWKVDVPHLRDWPETSERAFMIQGAYGGTVDDFKRNLKLLARHRVTSVALEFGPQVVLDFDPSIATGGRFSKTEARGIIDYGRSLGLKPIGYLNLLGHLDRAYRKPPYTQHGGIDVRSDEAYEKFVYPILDEMLEVYGPIEYFHAGMDEAWELFTWLSKQNEDVTALIARHIQRVNDHLKARGVKLVIWHDMLMAPTLADRLGGPIGPANGGPPQNTAAALELIPKDVILDYWFYDSHAAYPALDWLRQQGFCVWASPWKTPFSLVRYAQARKVPTMGTLWSGPPRVFASPMYSPVTALYAQAAWNPAPAPDTVMPEPQLIAAAQRATNAVLWGRRDVIFPGAAALRLTPQAPQPLAWPPAEAAEIEQHEGVPLCTDQPVMIPPLADRFRPLTDTTGAATVVLPGGPLTLDGVNTSRGESQLILYAAPHTSTETNIYGVEAIVSAEGEVLDVRGYRRQDNAIPPGGFVLSAHQGNRPAKFRRIESLRRGDRVAVLDAGGRWIGGLAPIQLLIRLPNGRLMRPNVENGPREADCLVLYHAGYRDGRTGANEHGVEVAVSDGKVTDVQAGRGNMAIPPDGFVLSAHAGESRLGFDALGGLKAGDPVSLVVDQGGERFDLAQALRERRVTYPIGTRVTALYLAANTERTATADAPLGKWEVRYDDGAVEHLPVRYGCEAIPAADALPTRQGGPAWLIQNPVRAMVLPWTNPHPEKSVRELVFEPSVLVLQTGLRVVAVTAAVSR